MSYAMESNYMYQWIENRVRNPSYAQTKLWNFFKSNSKLWFSLPEGILDHITTQVEKMEPGNIISDLSELTTNQPRLTETTTSLCTLGAKLSIPKMTLDRWTNNNLVNFNLAQLVDTQMDVLYQQVDQFLWMGDSFKDINTNDRLAGEARHNGLVASGTTIAGGIGSDDNLTASGDYMHTLAVGTLALEDAGFESEDGYFIMSDNKTQKNAKMTNSLYISNVPDSEYAAIRRDPDVKDWIYSPNLTDSSGTQYMLFTNPFTSKGEPAYRMLEGYSFRVIPFNNGGLNSNGRYEMAIVWSGALEVFHSDAIQVTGSLTTS